MKKYILRNITTAVFFVLLLMQVGCEKAFEEALDRADDSRENLEGMLGDPDKVRGMLNACYQGVPQDRTDLYFWSTEECLTDNAFDDQGQSVGNWRSGLLTPAFPAVWFNRNTGNQYTSAGGGSFWGRYWGGIRQCNTFIQNEENITVSLDRLPQDERDLMKDEAIVLRAYFHLKLISMYGPIPFMEANMEVNFSGWAELERPTYDEVATRIADELQGVIDRGIIPLKREPFNVNDKYRIPLSFAYGLKSRVLLFNASPLNNPSGDKAKYEAAAAAAKQFLDLNAYSLEPFENTPKMYLSPIAENIEAVEVIWRGRQRRGNFDNVHGMNFAAAVPKKSNYTNFKAGETPTQEVVDCYELSNGAMIVENYDASHAKPTFTAEALAAGYDDVNAPYENRDARFYRDILFNGNVFGESYQMGTITMWTYKGAPGTGSNGNVGAGDRKRTFSGYYYKKGHNPLWYGKGAKGAANNRAHYNHCIMRYAEIYLNYAEALCGAGRIDDACNALDMTRLRAGQPSIKLVPGYQANKEWLMRRIQNERRVELVVEDHRFYDVRRWDIISNQNNNTISGMEIVKDGENFTHTRYQTPFVWECHNEKYKVLPIPLSDAKLLPALGQPAAWQ